LLAINTPELEPKNFVATKPTMQAPMSRLGRWATTIFPVALSSNHHCKDKGLFFPFDTSLTLWAD